MPSNQTLNNKRKIMTKKRKIILGSVAAAVIVVFSAVIYGTALYMVDYGLSPVSSEKIAGFQKDDSHWLNSKSTVIETTSFDGLNLKAYLVKAPEATHRYGLFMHGYRDTPFKMADYALHFYDKGWNVVLPGQRGHGWSDGNHIDMGVYARKDVHTWIGEILKMDPEAEIMLYGVSMGAATVMNSTGLPLPGNVKCCVEDCGYSSVWGQFTYRLKEEFHLPPFPVLNLASRLCKKNYGFSFKDIAPEKEIHNCKIPVIFIHGDADDYVPFYMQDKVFNAAICEKEKVVIPGAPHAKSIYTDPELYWSTVDRFVAKYIK